MASSIDILPRNLLINVKIPTMKSKVVFFDCDGVLIFGNPWGTLELALDIPVEFSQRLWNDYYLGKITMDYWNSLVEEMYRGKSLTKAFYQEQMKKFHINPEAYEIIAYLKQKDIKTAIISSGTDYYVKKVAEELRIDFWRANYRFLFDREGKFIKFKYDIEDPKAKVKQVKEICESLGVKPVQTIFVGDSDNDLEAFKLTKHGVLYKSSNEIHKKIAWKTIENLVEIKDIIEVFF